MNSLNSFLHMQPDALVIHVRDKIMFTSAWARKYNLNLLFACRFLKRANAWRSLKDRLPSSKGPGRRQLQSTSAKCSRCHRTCGPNVVILTGLFSHRGLRRYAAKFLLMFVRGVLLEPLVIYQAAYVYIHLHLYTYIHTCQMHTRIHAHCAVPVSATCRRALV
jgi:hypothetical protein